MIVHRLQAVALKDTTFCQQEEEYGTGSTCHACMLCFCLDVVFNCKHRHAQGCVSYLLIILSARAAHLQEGHVVWVADDNVHTISLDVKLC